MSFSNSLRERIRIKYSRKASNGRYRGDIFSRRQFILFIHSWNFRSFGEERGVLRANLVRLLIDYKRFSIVSPEIHPWRETQCILGPTRDRFNERKRKWRGKIKTVSPSVSSLFPRVSAVCLSIFSNEYGIYPPRWQWVAVCRVSLFLQLSIMNICDFHPPCVLLYRRSSPSAVPARFFSSHSPSLVSSFGPPRRRVKAY